MPPPFGLTSAHRSSSPASRMNWSATEAKASFTSTTAMSSQPRPARASARSHACGLPCSIRWGRRRPGRTRRTARAAPGRASSRRPRSRPAPPRRRRRSGSSSRPSPSRREGRPASAPRALRARCRRAASRRRRRRHRVCGFDDLDRHDLALEAALLDRGQRAAVRLVRVRVELLAGEPPLLGDQLGRDPLRDDLPALEQLSARGRRRSSPSARATSTRPRPRRRRRAAPTRPRPRR